MPGVRWFRCMGCGHEEMMDSEFTRPCDICHEGMSEAPPLEPKEPFIPTLQVTPKWKPRVWRDICETPILVESKAQLKEECKKHGVRSPWFD